MKHVDLLCSWSTHVICETAKFDSPHIADEYVSKYPVMNILISWHAHRCYKRTKRACVRIMSHQKV